VTLAVANDLFHRRERQVPVVSGFSGVISLVCISIQTVEARSLRPLT